jgi:hypothetical protein
MIKLILKFFYKICDVKKEKIVVQVIAHRNIEILKAVEYWESITGVPKEQFIKTYQSKRIGAKGKRNNTLTYGTVHIRINSVKLFFRIIGWIEGFKKMKF